ncbi:hypothetical protein ACIRL2_30815 [Embleya sp. NPDC127516]
MKSPTGEPALSIAVQPEFEAVEVARTCGRTVWKPLAKEIKMATHRD